MIVTEMGVMESSASAPLFRSWLYRKKRAKCGKGGQWPAMPAIAAWKGSVWTIRPIFTAARAEYS